MPTYILVLACHNLPFASVSTDDYNAMSSTQATHSNDDSTTTKERETKAPTKISRKETPKQKKCGNCQVLHKRDAYSNKQWKKFPDEAVFCLSCILLKQTRDKNHKPCTGCSILLKKDEFSNSQWKGPACSIRCKPCVKKIAPISKKEKRQRQEKPNDAATSSQCSDVKKRRSSNSDNSKCTAEIGKEQEKDPKKKEKVKFTDQEIKRTLMLRADSFPPDQHQKQFQIECVCAPISKRDENNMMGKVIEEGYYGPFRETSKAALALTSYIQSNETNMTMDQALSLRSALLQSKATKRNYIIQKNAKKLYRQYKAGKTVVELAESLDCPPMNVFRVILSEMKYGKMKIKKSLKNPSTELKEREQREFIATAAVDCVSMANQDDLQKAAAAFEDDIGVFLKGKNIAFVTQNELSKEQESEFGKAVLTPDFLLLDNVEVNGEPINWIDAKAYYGAYIPYQVSKMAKQMSRYIEHWGSGAVIFGLGCNEMVTIDKCLMLNASDFMEAEISPN